MSAFLSGAPVGWLGLLLLIAVSALVVLGLCRSAKLGDQDKQDLTNHTPEEPQP